MNKSGEKVGMSVLVGAPSSGEREKVKPSNRSSLSPVPGSLFCEVTGDTEFENAEDQHRGVLQGQVQSEVPASLW